MPIDYENVLPRVPHDEEGFVVSFSVDEPESITSFYDTFGFVVIQNCISDEQAATAYCEAWDIIEECSKALYGRDLERENAKPSKFKGFLKKKTSLPAPVNRNNPDTWIHYWPFRSGGRGLLGNGVISTPAAWDNRQAENLYKAFTTIFKTNELLVSCDRYGFMRPTKNIAFSSGVESKPDWATEESWVHWDLNPWFWTGVKPVPDLPAEIQQQIIKAWQDGSSGLLISENNDLVDFKGYPKLQGLVALIDSRSEDGGFCCVPGFHKVLKQWAEENVKSFIPVHFVELSRSEELFKYLTKIPIRKGSLVIWSSELPHCNYPNASPNPRACQYIKMFPLAVLEQELVEPRKNVVQGLLNSFTPSPLGEKLFGLHPWE
jgi:hypothetical protein